jgi:hypothetical protein
MYIPYRIKFNRNPPNDFGVQTQGRPTAVSPVTRELAVFEMKTWKVPVHSIQASGIAR